MTKKHIKLMIWSVLIVGLCALQPHAGYKDSFPFFTWNGKETSAEKSDIVRVKIRDTIFNIPREYLKIPVSSKGLEQTGASIIFWYPSMKSIKTPKEGQDAIFFYMQYIEGDTDISERLERKRRRFSLEDEKRIHNLMSYKKILKLNREYRDDLFLNQSNGKIRGYIECNALNSIGNPRCNYAFQEDGIFFHISFNRTDLPEWREIEAQVINLTHQFKEKGE